jgi:hypothetical protein
LTSAGIIPNAAFTPAATGWRRHIGPAQSVRDNGIKAFSGAGEVLKR